MTAGLTDARAVTRQELAGLRPEPLASYLAGLGLIRLIGTADPAATFAWSAGGLVIGRGQAAGWISADGKADKQRLVQEFRNRCPESLLPWIDACVVLADERAFFPPLLGTGGNDGRLDFSTNFHEQLLVVLDPSPAGRKRSLACAGRSGATPGKPLPVGGLH